MYSYETEALARMVIEDRLRDAHHQRLVREARRHHTTSSTPPPGLEPRRRSRLRSVLHLGQAYG